MLARNYKVLEIKGRNRAAHMRIPKHEIPLYSAKFTISEISCQHPYHCTDAPFLRKMYTQLRVYMLLLYYKIASVRKT